MAKAGRYEAVVGVNYPDGKGGEVRREPGDRFDDLPASASWLVEQGAVMDRKAEVSDGQARQ